LVLVQILLVVCVVLKCDCWEEGDGINRVYTCKCKSDKIKGEKKRIKKP
jgi:hypothetical protein